MREVCLRWAWEREGPSATQTQWIFPSIHPSLLTSRHIEWRSYIIAHTIIKYNFQFTKANTSPETAIPIWMGCAEFVYIHRHWNRDTKFNLNLWSLAHLCRISSNALFTRWLYSSFQRCAANDFHSDFQCFRDSQIFACNAIHSVQFHTGE